MSGSADDLRFPNFADEEQMVGPMTVSEAFIITFTIFLLILTKMFIACVMFGCILWYGYQQFREKSSANALLQMCYRVGLIVPKSHLFPEPSIVEFRE